MADTPTAVPQLTPGDYPARQSASDRLESWKEIAVYLNRTLRTVQRWEKSEGLPVHQHQHEDRASVYAFKGEIDAWWKARRIHLEGGGKQQGEEVRQVPVEEPEGPTPARKVWPLHWSAWLVVVVAAGMVALLVFQPWNGHGRS